MEYILYCDESSGSGKYYGDFFGGCLISSIYYKDVVDAIEKKKADLHLQGEIKWTKVTANYLEKYIEIVDLFFQFVKEGKIKVRIMFRGINDLPSNPIQYGADDKYFKLYYQFIKHAFGLRYIPTDDDVFLRIYLDQLPDKREKCNRFKEFLQQLPDIKEFQDSSVKLHIREGDIAEVNSHDHVLLQCTDIVLGSMYFRLNALHLEKVDGKTRRGKRTIAKEKLYRHINSKICEIIPHFNIGITTGKHDLENPSWELPYSHWKFKPK